MAIQAPLGRLATHNQNLKISLECVESGKKDEKEYNTIIYGEKLGKVVLACKQASKWGKERKGRGLGVRKEGREPVDIF